ncbi:MAG TPA: glucokinase [Rectinemataceae bacterium]|nr:glucokinase [Rectinemataceae bacterium]
MSEHTSEHLVLAADIGGTNTNIALVLHRHGRFEIVLSRQYSTQAEISLIEPMARFLDLARAEGFVDRIDVCCVSAAGPVKNGAIQLTNAPWAIRAAEISEHFGLTVHLINDFTAISYAVVLLDPKNRKEMTQIPHCDGSEFIPEAGVALVVGAGTGLGVGFIDKHADGSCRVYPSEGGHSALPCWDELSLAFYRWLKAKIGFDPGVELAVSGQGIDNIFAFLCSDAFDTASAQGPIDATPAPLALSILAKSEHERPALIASNRKNDPRCSLAMELFCEFYARKVSSLAASFLPSGGIYLAGGISSKNEAFLLDDNRFMRIFERNYASHIREFLAAIPVMIVRNYSISLIGAANAAVQLGR